MSDPDDPLFVAARPRDPMSAQEARATLLAAIAQVEEAPLSNYSLGERTSWPTQLDEAAAFRGLTVSQVLAGELGNDGTDLTLTPFLVGACSAELGDADEAERVDQVNDLAFSVMTNAKALADLSQALVGIRRRAFSSIDEAEDPAAIGAALAAALEALGALT